MEIILANIAVTLLAKSTSTTFKVLNIAICANLYPLLGGNFNPGSDMLVNILTKDGRCLAFLK